MAATQAGDLLAGAHGEVSIAHDAHARQEDRGSRVSSSSPCEERTELISDEGRDAELECLANDSNASKKWNARHRLSESYRGPFANTSQAYGRSKCTRLSGDLHERFKAACPASQSLQLRAKYTGQQTVETPENDVAADLDGQRIVSD